MSHCHTILQSLRQMGFRITPQREMIVQALAHSDGHLTAEQIFDQVRTRTQVINIATVYRTLEMLVQHGLAARVALQDGQMVYTPQTHGPHIHLICRRCGGITDAENDLVQLMVDGLRAQYGFCADMLHLSMTGLCQSCHAQGN